MVSDSSKLAELCFGETDPSVAVADVSRHTARLKEQSKKLLEYLTIFPFALWKGHESKQLGGA
jgi:hypothetical protein